MKYRDAAKAALDCQDACNLSGVAFDFAGAVDAICEEQQRLGESTEWKNRHPIAALFLSKLDSLNGRQSDADFSACYAAVRRIAEPKEGPQK